MLMGMMMTEIKRFDFLIDDFDDAYMVEGNSGDYVKYEDYESMESEMRCLQSDYNVLRRDYETLQAGLKKLYLES